MAIGILNGSEIASRAGTSLPSGWESGRCYTFNDSKIKFPKNNYYMYYNDTNSAKLINTNEFYKHATLKFCDTTFTTATTISANITIGANSGNSAQTSYVYNGLFSPKFTISGTFITTSISGNYLVITANSQNAGAPRTGTVKLSGLKDATYYYTNIGTITVYQAGLYGFKFNNLAGIAAYPNTNCSIVSTDVLRITNTSGDYIQFSVCIERTSGSTYNFPGTGSTQFSLHVGYINASGTEVSLGNSIYTVGQTTTYQIYTFNIGMDVIKEIPTYSSGSMTFFLWIGPDPVHRLAPMNPYTFTVIHS